MHKSTLGLAALGSLGMGLAILGYLMAFDRYGGHSAAGLFWLSLLLVAVGLFLTAVYVVVRVVARLRARRED